MTATSTRPPEADTLPNQDPARRSRVLWELLDAVDRHIDNSPSSVWDQAVIDLAEHVSAGLASRVRKITAERVVDSAPTEGSLWPDPGDVSPREEG